FELLQQRVGLASTLLDQVGEHLLCVAAGHPTPLDGVIDDLLQSLAAEGDAALEALAELLDALVEPGYRSTACGFFRRFGFFGCRFLGGGFFASRGGFGFFPRFAG